MDQLQLALGSWCTLCILPPMQLSASEAAARTGLTKAGIVKAIKQGRISGQKDAKGEWRIDAAELFRVYPPVSDQPPTDGETKETDGQPVAANHSSAELKVLQAELEGHRRLIEQLTSERDHLRDRLDQEAAERRQLTAVLTDQRAPAPRSWWERLLRR